MIDPTTMTDEQYVFYSRLRLHKNTLYSAIFFLLIGLPAFGFFLYLILTGYTDDRALLISTGIFVLVGIGSLLASRWAKGQMVTNFPELWADYQTKIRKTSEDD
jgi:hypothetical protein